MIKTTNGVQESNTKLNLLDWSMISFVSVTHIISIYLFTLHSI